ncbi:hypothetical protein SHKM778_37600 [Streptomyces sp. KM77-8]|uniref:DNA ligase D polymerase domain-containing protein n=1 Tax=Streptomyces haneummycinicus TaxID=3074435 RepID=A0AAT9HJ34_9ACTN
MRRAAIAVGRELERRMPEQVTIKWWKEERGERIFVDYNQTARDRTIASAYSVRPRPHAPVSAPLRWEEAGAARPRDFDITTMPARFAELGDVHADMDDHAFHWSPCSNSPAVTNTTTAWAICRTRPSIRRCRGAPAGTAQPGQEAGTAGLLTRGRAYSSLIRTSLKETTSVVLCTCSPT